MLKPSALRKKLFFYVQNAVNALADCDHTAHTYTHTCTHTHTHTHTKYCNPRVHLHLLNVNMLAESSVITCLLSDHLDDLGVYSPHERSLVSPDIGIVYKLKSFYVSKFIFLG